MRYFAFHGKNIGQFAIITLGPQMVVRRGPDELHINVHRIATFCTLPSRRFATPSCRAISRKLSGALAYFEVEVREITFSAATLAKRVRISSWMPSAK